MPYVIEHTHQLRDITFERICQAKQDREPREHQAPFDVADEGDTSRALFGDVALSEAAGDAELA
jgi:hypothetical protein